LGGKYVYHYGSHAAAALLSRVSALPPHQAVFLVLTPTLLIGILAAAVVAVEAIGSRLPAAVALPLLLVAAPSLWYPFWHDVAPRITTAMADRALRPIEPLLSDYVLWGAAHVNGQTLAS